MVWGRPSLTSGDVVGHLFLIDLSRQNHHSIPDVTGKFLLAGPETYPVLFHQLLSFLPQGVVDRLEPLTGTLLEMLQALFVFGVGYGVTHTYWHGASPVAVAFGATCMLALTPLLVENEGRVFRMSARPFGTLLATIALSSMVGYLVTHSPWFAMGAAVFVALVGLSSKFGVQALVFISVGISILSLDHCPLLILGAGFVVALLLSRGHYWQVLCGHVRHLQFHRSYGASRHPSTLAFNLKQVVGWPVILLRSPKEAIRLLLTHYVFISFTLFPWSILLFASYVYNPHWVAGVAERLFFFWYLAALITMVLTATKWFSFLGEAHRYVIYAVAPVCLLAAYRLVRLNAPILWWIIGSLVLISLAGFVWAYFRYFRARAADPDIQLLYEWLERQTGSTILTIDLRLGYLLCFRTPHRAVNTFSNLPSGAKQEAYKRLWPKWYPYPAQDLWSLIREYGVDMLIVDRRQLESILRRDPTYVYDFAGMRKIYQQGPFVVYDVASDEQHDIRGRN